jgi:hypothetical protein
MSVRVINGANEGNFPFVGRTVQHVGRVLREVFNVPESASAFLNGHETGRHELLKDGDTLEFMQAFGQKGGLHDYWSEKELIGFFGSAAVRKMQKAGMELTPQPVLAAEEVVRWGQWLRGREHAPSSTIPVRVDIENEWIEFQGKTFELDRQMAAVVQCLIEAQGHRCSTSEMKDSYPQCIMDERLDLTIKRRLKPHHSGIGDYIQSDRHGYRLVLSGGE